MDAEYPTRCRIVDVTGQEVLPGIEGRTPDESKPHIGKLGLAEEVGDNVRITLDDGTIIWGYDCWWVPIPATQASGAEAMGWPESQVQAVGEAAPKSWEDFRLGCIGTYRGGHDGAEAGAFVHGMNTVFSLLEHEFPPAESCKAVTILLETCRQARACLLGLMPDDGPMARQMQKMVGELSSAIESAAPPASGASGGAWPSGVPRPPAARAVED